MVEFTFLEVHFEDADLTANAPYSYGDGETENARGEAGAPAAGASGRRGTIFALLVGLAFSVAIAYLVRRKVRGDGREKENGDGASSV
jgi:hypothetical protein